MTRIAARTRSTRETDISLRLELDRFTEPSIRTGLGFLDHMLTALATHGRFSLELSCTGDLVVDDHHTVEDCALLLGQAFDESLGAREGIERFGTGFAPMDEALCRCVIDFSGRPSAAVNLGFTREMIGQTATENLTHFFQSFASTARCGLHIDLIRGENDHHKAEAGFKSLGLALRQAMRVDKASKRVPSTKGSL